MSEEYNDVAMQMIKSDLGYGIYVYRPVGLVKGCYDSSLDVFTTVYGETYESIKSNTGEENGIFYAPHSLNELMETYKEVDELAVMNKFYDDLIGYLYVGLCDFETWNVEVAAIDLDSICGLFEQKNNEEVIDGQEKNIYFRFTEDNLKELMKLDSLKKIREVLNEIIDQAHNINFNEEQEEKELEIDTNDSNKKLSVAKEESKKMKLSELKNEVLNCIIGQDEAVKSVTTTMIVNENSKNPKHKAHILIAGPSGTGKTEMMNIISKKMNKPVFKADATAYTKEGYVGKSVYSMLRGLLSAADEDIEKAQNGILIIDEIDKKAGGSERDDISGTAVLNSLLKIMDRDIVEIETSKDQIIPFDTSNLTIVFMGAFSDLYSRKENKNEIGFGTTSSNEEKDIKITKQDLIEYGLPAEFLGRISKVVYTKELKENDLVNILLKSEISPLKMEEEFFADLGIKLKYNKQYVKQLAKNCIKHKTGARELKSEVQKSLERVYEEVLDNPEKVKVLKLTADTANDNKKYFVN